MLQSLYITAIANQIAEDRLQAASRARHAAPRRRRLFARRERRAPAPLTALRAGGAGR
jgi:hypothetical protein